MAELIKRVNLDVLLAMHVAFWPMLETARRQWLNLRRMDKFAVGQDTTFSLPPGGIETFYAVLALMRQIAIAIGACRNFGIDEDVGYTNMLSTVSGPAAALMRTALADASASDGVSFRLHK
jgi:hypothetical protein